MPSEDVVRFERSLAQVFVTDVARALDFYRVRLGFTVVFTYGEPPFYAEVARGGASFNVRHVDATPFRPGVRDVDQLLSVAIVTTDVHALFEAYAGAGVDFQQPLQRTPWGGDEFVVRDLDGNLLLFGSPAG